jgi:hypothetical protein
MSHKHTSLGLAIAICLSSGGLVMAQLGGGGGALPTEPVKPTGPAAKKADDLIRAYTARIEKEIEQGRKEVDRLRAELHELIDVRYEMDAAIAELRGDLASKGTYSGGPVLQGIEHTPEARTSSKPAQGQMIMARRDLFYGLGSALPSDPTPEQREQIRRLAPRGDLKRTIERLRDEVDATRAEVDQLAYRLLNLRAGVPDSYMPMGGMVGMGGGMGGGVAGGMGGGFGGNWFGSIGTTGSGGFR